MLFVPVSGWRADWSSTAAFIYCWAFFFFFFLLCMEAVTVSEIVSYRNVRDNSKLQSRCAEWSPLLNSLHMLDPVCLDYVHTWLVLFLMNLSILWKIRPLSQFWKCYISRIIKTLIWISSALLQFKLRKDLGCIPVFMASFFHRLQHAPKPSRSGFMSILFFLL